MDHEFDGDSLMNASPYVYRLTDRTNSMRYIGSRYARGCCPEDLGVSYFTSSRRVAPLFKVDPARFEKQIIVSGTKEYVIAVENQLIDLYDAVMSNEFYNRTNAKAIHPEDNGGKKGGARSKELGLIQALGRSGAGGRAVAKTGKLKDAARSLHSVKNEDGKSVVAVKAGKATAAGGTLSSAGKLAGQIAVETGQLRSVASKGGKKGGAVCKELGLGVCGMSLEQRRQYALISNVQRWKCIECSMVSNAAALGRHQKFSGHTGKERIL